MRVVLIVFVCACALASAQIGGGFSELPQSEWADLKSSLTESLGQLHSEQGHHLELVELETVRKQTVAGTNYEIKAWLKEHNGSDRIKCDIKVWEQLWAHFRDVDIKCAEKSYKVVKGKHAE